MNQLHDFDYDLPAERIALRPASPRDTARLMVVTPGASLSDRTVADLPDLLRPGDVMVFNDTRVMPARLLGIRRRESGAVPIEATLLRELDARRWSAFARPGKRLQPGDRVRFAQAAESACLLSGLDATVEAKAAGGEIVLAFDLAGPVLHETIAAVGAMPLPPYIAARRAEDERDRIDYQTVYARRDGSVAAPTAGLHFTRRLLERLQSCGVETRFVTLHVGAGTFLPVKTERVEEHVMHAETAEISAETAEALNVARRERRRVVAVGTTTLRLLESATDAGAVTRPFTGETNIFIRPGRPVRSADALMTNFHLPRSTLLMLVAAFSGLETMRAAYAHAVGSGYRFYSYGDAGLWFRAEA
jgi:S-adenosylmethionine:tRNA ribosyltransferase-isomerase